MNEMKRTAAAAGFASVAELAAAAADTSAAAATSWTKVNEVLLRKATLHLNAARGNLRVLARMILVPSEADAIDMRDAAGATPLLHAARNGYADAVCALAAGGASTAVDTRDLSPAMITLLKHAATVTATGRSRRWTLLHHAAALDNPWLVQALVQRGDDARAVDSTACTPLDVAAQHNASRVVRMLYAVAPPPPRAWTPLHWAALVNAAETIEVLAACGADVCSTDGAAVTPLHVAVQRSAVAAAAALLRHGALVCATDARGRSSLWIAAAMGHGEVARLLLQCGGDARDAWNEDTCLHRAAYSGDAALVKALLDGGAVVDAVNSRGATPLHYALARGSCDIVTVLLSRGASPTTRCGGATPLHVAARYAAAAIPALVAAGAAPQLTTVCAVDGATPLEAAVAARNVPAATALLEAGAPVTYNALRGALENLELLCALVVACKDAAMWCTRDASDGCTLHDAAIARGHPFSAALLANKASQAL